MGEDYTCSGNDADVASDVLAARLAEAQRQIALLQQLQADPMALIASQQAQQGAHGGASSWQASLPLDGTRRGLQHTGLAAGELAGGVGALEDVVGMMGAAVASWLTHASAHTADESEFTAATSERRRLSSRLSGRFLKGGGGDETEEGENGGTGVTFCNPTDVDSCAVVGGGCMYANISTAGADFDSMMNAVISSRAPYNARASRAPPTHCIIATLTTQYAQWEPASHLQLSPLCHPCVLQVMAITQIVTFDTWSAAMYTLMLSFSPWVWIYFLSCALLGGL